MRVTDLRKIATTIRAAGEVLEAQAEQLARHSADWSQGITAANYQPRRGTGRHVPCEEPTCPSAATEHTHHHDSDPTGDLAVGRMGDEAHQTVATFRQAVQRAETAAVDLRAAIARMTPLDDTARRDMTPTSSWCKACEGPGPLRGGRCDKCRKWMTRHTVTVDPTSGKPDERAIRNQECICGVCRHCGTHLAPGADLCPRHGGVDAVA